MEADQIEQPSRNDLLWVGGFVAVAVLGCIGVLFGFWFATDSGDWALVPMCFAPVLVGSGAAAMIYFRNEFDVNPTRVMASVILWMAGVSCVSFGGTASFFYDEPNQFTENFLFSLFLCIVPGVIFILLGLGAYGYQRFVSRDVKRDDGAFSPNDMWHPPVENDQTPEKPAKSDSDSDDDDFYTDNWLDD